MYKCTLQEPKFFLKNKKEKKEKENKRNEHQKKKKKKHGTTNDTS